MHEFFYAGILMNFYGFQIAILNETSCKGMMNGRSRDPEPIGPSRSRTKRSLDPWAEE